MEKIFFVSTLFILMSCDTFVFVLLIVAIAIYVNRFVRGTEGFNVDSQNFIYNNKFDNAEMLQYDGSNNDVAGLYQSPNVPIYGASVDFGVNQNSQSDVFDVRGFNNSKGIREAYSDVNNFTQSVDDAQLRRKFERIYLLDPSDGPDSVARYDISQVPMDPRCCPATYSPNFDLGGDNASFANKYVANNYSGMNYDSPHASCACIDKSQAAYFGARGGNAI
jgi:hypothetical protein